MAGRASIVGAAATHVGKVRDHNEDSHFLDTDAGLFLVCDGMGGHAAGEVASALAVAQIRARWMDEATRRAADGWLKQGTADARRLLFGAIRSGVLAAHEEILAEGAEDDTKSGMGTTLVGALVVGNELVFAHAGDSRAYLVRDGIAMQLTEDHTLLARLLAAGIDVDVSGEGARFRSMLTNALGIGQECKVSTFVVPLADGDRFLLCSDGISEYVPEAEVGTVLSRQPSPAKAAQKLVELALERGGGDNATAVVVRVLEAGETPAPAERRRRDDDAIRRCPLWGDKLTPQQRLRALRVAIERDHAIGERVPAHTLGDRVAWIVVEGRVIQEGREHGPGSLVYPESLIADTPPPSREELAVARTDVRALALRADDFRELCDDEAELGETLQETLGALVAGRARPGRLTRNSDRADTVVERPIGGEASGPHAAPSTGSGPVRAAAAPAAVPGPVPPAPPPAPPPKPTASDARRSASLPASAPQRPSPLPSAMRPRTSSQPPPPGGTPRAPTPVPLPSATSYARAQSQPGPPTPGPSGLQARPVAAAAAIALSDPESEPEIETVYEMDAEPPPLPDPDHDDDDPIAEMTVSMSTEDGDERVTEMVTDTDELTLTITVHESTGDLDEEPTRIRAITADDAIAVSGTISPIAAPRARAKRISDNWSGGGDD